MTQTAQRCNSCGSCVMDRSPRGSCHKSAGWWCHYHLNRKQLTCSTAVCRTGWARARVSAGVQASAAFLSSQGFVDGSIFSCKHRHERNCRFIREDKWMAGPAGGRRGLSRCQSSPSNTIARRLNVGFCIFHQQKWNILVFLRYI